VAVGETGRKGRTEAVCPGASSDRHPRAKSGVGMAGSIVFVGGGRGLLTAWREEGYGKGRESDWDGIDVISKQT